jgi:guanine deaminase
LSTLLRTRLFHTPRDPFVHDDAFEAIEDGALLIGEGGRIEASGEAAALLAAHPDAEVIDRRDALALPGFVDAHVHYPQIPVIGAMGMQLLDWLQARTLPEEARLADADYARRQARTFLTMLAANGTTSALVFGAHFAVAMEPFFEEAEASGLRISAGLVVSDRELGHGLHITPERARSESLALAERWHGRGRLRYAVTPRFSLSCSDALLAACGEVLAERPELLFTSHLNEMPAEIAAVAALFPDAPDYLATYERHGLVGPRSVFAHNVHPGDDELRRLAAAGAAVCHCPSSNMFIGSGLFPLRRHLERGVRVCLGSDVGGGTGFSLLKEGLMAYQGQMLLGDDGYPLTPARVLHLATAAGAAALGLPDVGDLSAGSQADLVLLRPPAGSTLEAVLAHAPSADEVLAATITLARESCVAEVWVGGEPVYTRPATA